MIANSAEVATTNPEGSAFARVVDRWIYVFMAGLCIATVMAGFIPNSMRLLDAVALGQRPPIPVILHAHAMLMGTWMLLLFVQTSLMATGHRARHKMLGRIAMVLVPAIVLVMPGVVQSLWAWIALIPDGAMATAELAALKVIFSDILLEQIRIGIMFPVLVAWAILVRVRDPESHKRLMILATVLLMPAAVDRIGWLPATIPDNPASTHLYCLLMLLPVLIHDLARLGRIHPAFVLGIAANLPLIVVTHLLWSTPWWLEIAPRLLGL